MVRFFKPLILGIILYFSIKYVGGTHTQGLTLAAIPVVFGWLGVFTLPADFITGILIIGSLVWASMSSDMQASVKQKWDTSFQGGSSTTSNVSEVK